MSWKAHCSLPYRQEKMNSPEVLIVEDEAIIAQDLRLSLKRLGYSVSAVVNSGLAAIEHAKASPPDVVLMDLGLPGGMDGVQAAKHILEQTAVPLIFLTAHADQATLERINAVKPAGYVLKPYHQSELQTVLERVLGNHKKPNASSPSSPRQ